MNRRNTIQRTLILQTVRMLRSHVTSDDVYAAIVKTHPDISRGTVYRNLSLLAENGEIRKVEMPNGAVHYDYLCYEHYHAKCVKCGQVFDVEMEFIKDLAMRIKNNQGFEFISHDIIFKGVCLECNKSSKERSI
jgi:Fur family ferric uptake transcriptional regulator/Fur family peroxide stress response transcriptional regulator